MTSTSNVKKVKNFDYKPNVKVLPSSSSMLLEKNPIQHHVIC